MCGRAGPCGTPGRYRSGGQGFLNDGRLGRNRNIDSHVRLADDLSVYILSLVVDMQMFVGWHVGAEVSVLVGGNTDVAAINNSNLVRPLIGQFLVFGRSPS